MAFLQKAAEFSGYVSESSSFCLFILPPNQGGQQKRSPRKHVDLEIQVDN
jgi:hypothetical protein